jgi:cyclophilin family peptidyl-prolyl cis-trans isomerase
MSHRPLSFLVICSLAAILAAPPAAAQDPVVVIETNLGNITAELDRRNAPVSVANFLAYAESGFYNGTVFHRVIRGFMIQGGGMTADLQRKQTRAPIRNEATNGLSNDRGTLAMARTNVVDSATAQFFINTVDNVGLNNRGTDPGSYGYAVFGRVIDGMDVVDRIEGVSTGDRGPFRNVPDETVEILSVTLQ